MTQAAPREHLIRRAVTLYRQHEQKRFYTPAMLTAEAAVVNELTDAEFHEFVKRTS